MVSKMVTGEDEKNALLNEVPCQSCLYSLLSFLCPSCTLVPLPHSSSLAFAFPSLHLLSHAFVVKPVLRNRHNWYRSVGRSVQSASQTDRLTPTARTCFMLHPCPYTDAPKTQTQKNESGL